MPLHLEIQKKLASQEPQLEGIIPSVEEMRLTSKKQSQSSSKGPSVFSIENRTIDDLGHKIPIRIYTPREKRVFPLFIYLHGGGFVIGDLDSHDIICRNIANESGHKVISVDYRLAPEHPFPAAIQDCYAVFEWVIRNVNELDGDSSSISIGGDSAGGNLATVVCLMVRDRNKNVISKQVLFYPVTDYFSVLNKTLYRSYEKYGQYGLSPLKMSEFWRFYIGHSMLNKSDPYISPIQAKSLEGLPPAFIAVAELDVLRDEGEQYAKSLERDGVHTVLEQISGVNHGYLRNFPDIEQSIAVFKAASRFLNQPVEDIVRTVK